MTPMIEQLHTTIDTLKGEVKVLKGALKKSADAHGDALNEVENIQREVDKAQAHCEQLRTELETARRQYADDFAENDTAIKAICKRHGIAEDYGRDIDGFKSWVDCVEELSSKLAASQAREARLRKGLEDIVEHQRIMGGTLANLSTVTIIAKKALAETGEEPIPTGGTFAEQLQAAAWFHHYQEMLRERIASCHNAQHGEELAAHFDKYANDDAAKAIYDGWKSVPGWVPWVNRGNSDKQDEARKLARQQIDAADTSAKRADETSAKRADETAEWGEEFIATGNEFIHEGDQMHTNAQWCTFIGLERGSVRAFRGIRYRRRVQKGDQ